MPGSLQVDKEATTALLVLLLCFKPNISDIFQQPAAVVPSKECLHTSRDLLLSPPIYNVSPGAGQQTGATNIQQ